MIRDSTTAAQANKCLCLTTGIRFSCWKRVIICTEEGVFEWGTDTTRHANTDQIAQYQNNSPQTKSDLTDTKSINATKTDTTATLLNQMYTAKTPTSPQHVSSRNGS